MKALVTGGTGFLGGHIVDELVTNGHEVRCLIRDHNRSQRLVDLGVEVIEGDLREATSLVEAVRGIDYVFHAAAKVSDWGKWSEFYVHTVKGTENILIAAERAGVSRFIHISTVDVYDPKFMTRGNLLTESSPLVLETTNYFYARAKLMAEKRALASHNQGGMEVVVVRPATIYGPRDKTILPRFIEFLKDPLSGWVKNHNPVMGLVHVNDVVDLCMRAVISSVASGRIYNATSDQEVRIREFAIMVCKQLGLTVPTKTYPYALLWLIASLAEFHGAITRRETPPVLTKVGLRFLILEQRFSIQRAIIDLGWQPRVRLPEGLDSALCV